jgi:hypothetical protein
MKKKNIIYQPFPLIRTDNLFGGVQNIYEVGFKYLGTKVLY